MLVLSDVATQTLKLMAKKGREKKWTASVHTLHMPTAVITFMFKVLQEGLLRYIHMPKAVTTFVFKVLRSGLCFRRFRVFAVFAFSFFPVSVLGVFAFSRFRVFAFSCSAGGTPAAGTQISCAQYIPFKISNVQCCFSAYRGGNRGADAIGRHTHAAILGVHESV